MQEINPDFVVDILTRNREIKRIPDHDVARLAPTNFGNPGGFLPVDAIPTGLRFGRQPVVRCVIRIQLIPGQPLPQVFDIADALRVGVVVVPMSNFSP